MALLHQNVVEFVCDNPGCKVSDVANAIGVDMATALNALIDGHRMKTIRMVREEDGWHFHPMYE